MRTFGFVRRPQFIFMAIKGLNSEVLERIVKELGLQTMTEKLPLDLAPSIQPVLIANPKNKTTLVTSVERLTTGFTSLLTTHTTRETYLTGAWINNQTDATANNTLIAMGATLESGAVANILRLSKITLTAYQHGLFVQFDKPLQLAKGSAITFGTIFTVGASNTSAGIIGYEVDVL